MRAKTSKTPVYEYVWNHALPGSDASRYGAFHSSELPYVLNTLNRSDRPFTPQDQEIAVVMSSYWANFVTQGDPNGKGVAPWRPADDRPEVMEVSDIFQQIPVAGSPAKFDFWKSFLLAATNERSSTITSRSSVPLGNSVSNESKPHRLSPTDPCCGPGTQDARKP